MIAPSEKHLEDWLLKHPGVIIGDEEGYKAFQQYVLPSGITDLIFFGGSAPIILIELKKGKVDARALTQTFRYLRDLRAIAKIALDIIRSPFDATSRMHDPKIKAVLIGHGLDDKNLLIAAEMGDVEILTYDYNPETDDYDFEEHSAPVLDLATKYEYAQGHLGEAIQNGFVANVNERLEMNGGPTLKDIVEGIEIFMLKQDYGVVPFWEWAESDEAKGLDNQGGGE